LTRANNISGVPVVDGEELLGIVTSRDLRFETGYDSPVSRIMTPKDRLVTVREGAEREEVIGLLHKHRIEKVLVVNDKFQLRGLITVKDIQKAKENPNACKDSLGRLRAGAAVGTGQAVLDYVKVYVNERQAFGEPISHRQSVAFMVADMAIELQAMRLLTWKAASRATRGQDFAREVGLARQLCAEKGMKIGLDGVQLLGGHGFVKEHPVERWYRDLRAVGVMEGAVLV